MRKLYLDLDTLFDTRLGVLSQLSPEAVNVVINRPEYWAREHTDWSRLTNGLVTNEQFEAAWLKRTNKELRASIVSGIIPVLVNMLMDYQTSRREGVVDDDIILEINVNPYEFDSDEMDGLIEILQHEITHSEQLITFIDISLAELTPEFIRDRYSGMLFFDFHRWIKQHAEIIPKANCRHLPIVVPKLFEQDPSRLSIEERKNELLCFKLWLLDVLHLEFIDAQWFSMMRPV